MSKAKDPYLNDAPVPQKMERRQEKKRKPRCNPQPDWRSISDDKEKYQAYLCSRDWAKLKKAVHKRANGKCERCGLFNIGAVHHVTYARKYKEDLDDLAGWCAGCHKHLHDDHWLDPCRHQSLLREIKNYIREFGLAKFNRIVEAFQSFGDK